MNHHSHRSPLSNKTITSQSDHGFSFDFLKVQETENLCWGNIKWTLCKTSIKSLIEEKKKLNYKIEG